MLSSSVTMLVHYRIRCNGDQQKQNRKITRYLDIYAKIPERTAKIHSEHVQVIKSDIRL